MTVNEDSKPIELDWCCGVNTDIPVLNLTKKSRNHTIGFAANHLVVIQVKSWNPNVKILLNRD